MAFPAPGFPASPYLPSYKKARPAPDGPVAGEQWRENG